MKNKLYLMAVYTILSEIKNYLKKKKFKTNSDTEVFKLLYFGEKTFNYLDGMWCAIYDHLKNLHIK